jgi:radical SAM-linked protein
MLAPAHLSSATNGAGSAGPARFRVALELAVGGDVRFLSHHDELRLLVRALVRARWPLAYSHGFNPKPRMIVPLPRNVGTAAAAQLVLVDLCEPRQPGELFESLAGQLPPDCRLLRVMAPAPRGVPHARTVCYELELDPAEVGGLGDRIPELTARSTLVVQRDYGPGRAPRPIDIRPHIERIQLEGRRLRLVLRYRDQRTARPSEVITELGLAVTACNQHLCRTAVQWDTELFGPDDGPRARERNYFDNQEIPPKEDGGGA